MGSNINSVENIPLKQRWDEFRLQNPKTRVRDAAKELGVTEAELVASSCDGISVIRLKPAFKEIIKSFPELGFVMALTRNEAAVSEIKGNYKNISLNDKGGLALGDIDLRIFLEPWSSAFAVKEPLKDGDERRSFQFFDKHGSAVHKVYLNEKSDQTAYGKIIDEFKSDDQNDFETIEEIPAETPERPDSEIDVQALRNGWMALKDTHDFIDFLKNSRVSRLQAFRLAGDDLAYQIDQSNFPSFLNSIAEKKVKLMTFIGNKGMIQIYSNYINNVVPFKNWINVMDENYNMHLQQDLIASAWIVKKKKGDDWVSSLELFDERGEIIALFFNKKKETEPESDEWIEILKSLSTFEGT
jgi:putative hemin transport protein